MVSMTPAQFDLCVERALELLPDEIAALMTNVAVLVEATPPADEPSDLLGLYLGTPLTERWGFGGIGALPDRILVFREPTLAICETVGDVVDEVVTTVVHETAHFFGIEEDRIHELGWG